MRVTNSSRNFYVGFAFAFINSSKCIRAFVLAYLVLWLCTITASDNPSVPTDGADKKLPTFREYREKVIALAQSAKGAAAAAKAAAAASKAAAASSTAGSPAASSNPTASASAAPESGSSNGDSATSSPDVSKSALLLKKNVASVECGARALAWNKEAKDVEAILTDNRDVYMKNLCTADKWLDLQLCEPVRLRRLELANFELFSSAFKNVSLMASDAHPPREWIQVADLTLNASRTWQIFDLHTDQFVQYIRLRFSDHWGSEHYCTLTHLRLMGVLAADIVDNDPDGDDLWSDEHQRILALASGMDSSPGGESGGSANAAIADSGGQLSNDCGVANGSSSSSDTTPASQTQGGSSGTADRGSCPANCTFRRLLPDRFPAHVIESVWSSAAESASLKLVHQTSETATPSSPFKPDSALSAEPSAASVEPENGRGLANSSVEHVEPANNETDANSANNIRTVTDAANAATDSGESPPASVAEDAGSSSDIPIEALSSSTTPAPSLSVPHHPANGGGGFAVLASRLKELERNVSVSMRYLEELSLAFNRHVQRLSLSRQRNNSKLVRRRFDLAQLARISALERRLEAAPFAVGVVHCVFLVLHAALLAVCLRWRR